MKNREYNEVCTEVDDLIDQIMSGAVADVDRYPYEMRVDMVERVREKRGELMKLNAHPDRATVEHQVLYKKQQDALLALGMRMIVKNLAERIISIAHEPLPSKPSTRPLANGGVLSAVKDDE